MSLRTPARHRLRLQALAGGSNFPPERLGHSRRAGELRTYQRGFSLVEMLFYVALLSLSLLAVMQTLVVVTRSYGVFKAAQHIEQEASAAGERMIREIRDANGINDAGSALSSHPGKLLLTSTDASGVPRTVEFSLSGSQLSLKENGVVTGLLTSPKTSISTLVFRKITTTRSKGIKIEMILQAGSGVASTTEKFYITAALHDSY